MVDVVTVDVIVVVIVERIQDHPEGPPFSGQKRLFNFNCTPHGHKMSGLSASSGMSTGNISPPLSITPSEGYSPMEQYDFPGPFSSGQPAKRPRPVARGSSNDSSNHTQSGRLYSRDDGSRTADPTNLLSHQSTSTNAYSISAPIGTTPQQQYHSYQHQHQHQQYHQHQQQDTEAGRPRFIPGDQNHPPTFRDIVQAVAQSGTPVSFGRT